MAMMISMFNKIIHNKTIWLIFAILISIAFVSVYTGSQSGSKESVRGASEPVGRLYGEYVSRMEYSRTRRNVYVIYSMMAARALNIDEEMETAIRQEAWRRLATLKKTRQMKLAATSKQTVAMIKRQPIFQNQQTRRYDTSAYNAFINEFLPQIGMSARAFEQMMAENVLIEKAYAIVSLSALVTEDEIKEAFHLYNDRLNVAYATIPRSLDDLPEITEEDAKAYFERYPEKFIAPEKVLVSYVRFPIAEYTNSVVVTDDMVVRFYEENKQRFLKSAPETDFAGVPEYQPLEEVQEGISSELTAQRARQQAFNAADELVARLADEGVTFEQEAKKLSLNIISNVPAFAVTDSVPGVDTTAPFVQAAFALEQNATHYYSDPVTGRDTVYVIALRKKTPAFPLPFELAGADARALAKIEAEERAYVKKAEAVYAEIKTALHSGERFADAVSKYLFEVKNTEPFNASSPLEGEVGRAIMSAALRSAQGTPVNLIRLPDEFLLACVSSRETADEAAELPSMRSDLAAVIRNEKATQLIRSWQESLLKEADFHDLFLPPSAEES